MDGQDRGEDLFLGDADVGRRVDHQVHRHAPGRAVHGALLVELDHPAAGLAGLLEQAEGAIEVGLADQTRAVLGGRVVGHRPGHPLLGQLDEAIDLLGGDQAVIDGVAHLAVLDHLDPDDVLDPFGLDAVGEQDRRGLAAELQGGRDQVGGSHLGDLAADPGAAGVEQVVPAHRGELLGEVETADDHVDQIAVEGRVDHLAQELGAGGGELRGLEHHPVAGREHVDHRAEAEVEGEVPGDDVADHALGLAAHHRVAGPVHRRVGLARLGLDPLGEVLGDVGGAAGHAERFHLVGVQRRVGAEVVGDRLADRQAVGQHHLADRGDALQAGLQARARVGEEGAALGLEAGVQRLDRGGVVVLGAGRHLGSSKSVAACLMGCGTPAGPGLCARGRRPKRISRTAARNRPVSSRPTARSCLRIRSRRQPACLLRIRCRPRSG